LATFYGCSIDDSFSTDNSFFVIGCFFPFYSTDLEQFTLATDRGAPYLNSQISASLTYKAFQPQAITSDNGSGFMYATRYSPRMKASAFRDTCPSLWTLCPPPPGGGPTMDETGVGPGRGRRSSGRRRRTSRGAPWPGPTSAGPSPGRRPPTAPPDGPAGTHTGDEFERCILDRTSMAKIPTRRIVTVSQGIQQQFSFNVVS